MPVRPSGRCQRPLQWTIRAAMTSLQISPSARFRGIPHARLRAPFLRHLCREIPGDDVTRAPSLQLARAFRPGNPLREPCEQDTRYAARDAPETCPRAHGNPRVPNSPINTRRHFNRPRGRLVSDVECFRAGSRRRARTGRARSAPRTSHTPSREPGAVTTLTLYGPSGSLHPSSVWTRLSISTHAIFLTHAISLTLFARFPTHFDTLVFLTTHTGTSRYHKRSRGLHTPQAARVPIHRTHPLYLAWHDRTHLVVIRLKGA